MGAGFLSGPRDPQYAWGDPAGGFGDRRTQPPPLGRGSTRSDPMLPAHPLLKRIRASLSLAVIAVVLGLTLAAIIGIVAWALAAGLHHAATA